LRAFHANRATFGAGNVLYFDFDVFMSPASVSLDTKEQIDQLISCSHPFGTQDSLVPLASNE